MYSLIRLKEIYPDFNKRQMQLEDAEIVCDKLNLEIIGGKQGEKAFFRERDGKIYIDDIFQGLQRLYYLFREIGYAFLSKSGEDLSAAAIDEEAKICGLVALFPTSDLRHLVRTDPKGQLALLIVQRIEANEKIEAFAGQDPEYSEFYFTESSAAKNLWAN